MEAAAGKTLPFPQGVNETRKCLGEGGVQQARPDSFPRLECGVTTCPALLPGPIPTSGPNSVQPWHASCNSTPLALCNMHVRFEPKQGGAVLFLRAVSCSDQKYLIAPGSQSTGKIPPPHARKVGTYWTSSPQIHQISKSQT